MTLITTLFPARFIHSRRKTVDQYNVAFNRSGAALS